MILIIRRIIAMGLLMLYTFTGGIGTREFQYQKYGVFVMKNGDHLEYDKTFFYADYEEMLPAAKKNMKTYSNYIDEVLRITNSYRKAAGVAPLKLDNGLCEQASVRAEEVAWSGYWPSDAMAVLGTHLRPGGEEYSSIFKENGRTGHMGENLCKNKTTPSKACEAWKGSSGHYANMLDPTFTKIGIGVALDPVPVEEGGLGLVWVQHFYE